jgi:hypothetical protein
MKRPRIISAGGCVAALLLAACAGVRPNSTASLPSVTARSNPIAVPERVTEYSLSDSLLHTQTSDGLKGESLTGTATIECKSGGQLRAKFVANGTATGPYPGSFVATGIWRRTHYSDYLNVLQESFTITSGSRTITGHVPRRSVTGNGSCFFLKAQFEYRARGGHWRGSASASMSYPSYDFAETFQ